MGKRPNDEALFAHAYALGRHSKLQAEIHPGTESGWHVLVTVSGQERIAAGHLIARRFGVFLPEIDSEKPPKVKEIMFPGYLFVFVWDINWHWDRILGCPGVLEILAPIDEIEIDRVRAVENEKCPLAMTVELIGKSKRRWRKSRREDEQSPITNEVIAVRTWSAYTDGIDRLDGEGRSRLLRTALGLVS